MLDNVEKTANHFGRLIVERAQLELGTRRKQTAGSGRVYTGRKVASDNLRKSLDFTLQANKDRFSIQFGAKGTAAKYAGIVHDGRRRGKQPPIQELVDWMRKKRIRPRKEDGSFSESTESARRGLAFVIARSIGRHGTKEFPYYEIALKKYDTQMTDALLKAVELDVEIEFKDLG